MREPASGDVPSAGRGRSRPPVSLVVAGRILHRGQLENAEIGIDDSGRIVRLAKTLRGDRRLDYGDAVIIPAATDLHVHFREPGGPDAAENLETGTLQAALGGVGAVGDMPNNEPPTDSVEALSEKAHRARRRLAVDLLLYAGVTHRASIPELGRAAGAFKLYMAPSTGTSDAPSLDDVRATLQAVADTGLPLTVHAEDPRAFQPTTQLATTADWNVHRPPDAERAGVDALLPAPPSLRMHVAHVTLSPIVDRLRDAGQSFEATPHHLLLSARNVTGALGKVNPPLRGEGDRAALWARFASGDVPVLASDHAPHPPSAKDRAFSLAPSGMPGVETMLPLLLDRVRRGDVPLGVVVAAACDRPARWLGLPTGRIAPNHRANLVVVDFRDRTNLSAEQLHAPCHWTAFEGWEAIFPKAHLRDGELIVRDGQYVGRKDGAVVRPEYAPAPPPARRVPRGS